MNVTPCRHHQWELQEDGHYACPDCDATTSACLECGNPLDTNDATVCPKCIKRWRALLSDVDVWTTRYRQDPFSTIKSPTYDPDMVQRSSDDARLPFGLDAIYSDPDDSRIEALRTVVEVLAVYEGWADRWATARGESVDDTPLAFLTSRTLWALQYREQSGWDEYSTEARRARMTIRRLLGIAPEREPVPCVHCGGQIIREWRDDDGLDDLRRCTGCGIEWADNAHLRHTNHLVLQQLPETHPALQVTLEEANRIYRGRIGSTVLHKWRQRGKLLAVDHNVRGAEVFILGDVAGLVAEHEARTGRAGDTPKATA